MPDFTSFWRKNNYVNDAGDWVKQEGTGEADPDADQDAQIFHKANNYVWDAGLGEWVPQEP